MLICCRIGPGSFQQYSKPIHPRRAYGKDWETNLYVRRVVNLPSLVSRSLCISCATDTRTNVRVAENYVHGMRQPTWTTTFYLRLLNTVRRHLR
jgi:hypothetical protein